MSDVLINSWNFIASGLSTLGKYNIDKLSHHHYYLIIIVTRKAKVLTASLTVKVVFFVQTFG